MVDLKGMSIEDLNKVITEAQSAIAVEEERLAAIEEAKEIALDIEAIRSIQDGWGRLKRRGKLPASLAELEVGKSLKVTPAMKRIIELGTGGSVDIRTLKK
jgi:hypothetical protein